MRLSVVLVALGTFPLDICVYIYIHIERLAEHANHVTLTSIDPHPSTPPLVSFPFALTNPVRFGRAAST